MGMIEERNAFIEGHYRKNRIRLVKIMSRRTGYTNAEDVIQEAYCRALRSWDAFTPGSNFETWFRSICDNSHKDDMDNHTSAPFDGSQTTAAFSVKPMMEERFALQDVQDMLKGERPDHRMTFILRAVMGYSIEEVEKATGLSGENQKKIIQRLRAQLP